jgi:hypothetical protein
MTTVIAAAGSATDSVSASASVSTSAGTNAKSCKAHSGRAQAWRQHRRPRPSASASAPVSDTGNTAAPAPSQEVPNSGINAPSESTSAEPISSASEQEDSPSPAETPMPSSAETAPVVTAPPIQAGGDGEVVQNPPSSQVAQPSVVDTASSEVSSFTESSSSSTSSSSAQPSASAQGGGSDAPPGFGAEILQAHNSFRATWGKTLDKDGVVLMNRCWTSRMESDYSRQGKRILQEQELRRGPLVCLSPYYIDVRPKSTADYIK